MHAVPLIALPWASIALPEEFISRRTDRVPEAGAACAFTSHKSNGF
jgi:hypothetical protein